MKLLKGLEAKYEILGTDEVILNQRMAKSLKAIVKTG